MPTKVCVLETSTEINEKRTNLNMSDAKLKPPAKGKGVRFTSEGVDIDKLEKRYKESEFASKADARQSVALALDSLRIVCDSEEDINRDADLENPTKDSHGHVTFSNRVKFWVEKMIRPWNNNPVALAHFRSSHSMRNEQMRQKLTNRFIIHPYSLFRLIWDVLMIIILFVTILVLPIEVAFYSADLWDPKWKAFNLIVDGAFVIDICINMRTGFIINQVDECPPLLTIVEEDKQKGYTYISAFTSKSILEEEQIITKVVILDSKAIVKNYLKSWFSIDLISSIPMDYIVLSITGEGQVVLASTLRALRMVKFLSLLRILRFIRLIRYLSRMKEFMHVDAKILSILRLVMSILVFAHWNACIQYFIVFLQNVPDNSWLKQAELHHDNVTRWSIYSHAVYRGMSHMISIGYGKTPPEGNSETWTVVVSMMMGATFYAMFIAHVSAIVMSLDASGRHFQEKVCEVKDYMRFRRLPASLQQRVIDYYEYKYQQKLFDEHAILDERYLSYPLRKEIVMHNCRSLVQSVPFLRDSPSEFLVDVILKLNMHVYFPGDHIIQAGKKGDCMYFIEHGMVNVILSDGEVVNTLRDGSHFGEVSLLFDEKRIADVAAVETSYIYRLAKSDFEEVLEEYPTMRTAMIEVARYRLEQTQAKLGFKSSSATGETDSKEMVSATDTTDAACRVTSSEEAWILNEEGGGANINSNVNSNITSNCNKEESQDEDEMNMSMNNNTSREDSGTPYMDCSAGEAGPMVLDIVDEEEEEEFRFSSRVVSGQGMAWHPRKQHQQKQYDEEAYDCVYSIVDQVAERVDETRDTSHTGLRRRYTNDEPSLPKIPERF